MKCPTCGQLKIHHNIESWKAHQRMHKAYKEFVRKTKNWAKK